MPQMLQIGSKDGGFRALLELQKRRVLKAEHGDGAHAHILKLVFHFLSVPVVPNTGEVIQKHLPYTGESQVQGGPHRKTILHQKGDV